MLAVPNETQSQLSPFSSIPLSVFEHLQPAAAQERKVTSFPTLTDHIGPPEPCSTWIVKKDCPFTLFTDQRRGRNASLNSFGLDSAMPLSKSQRGLF